MCHHIWRLLTADYDRKQIAGKKTQSSNKYISVPGAKSLLHSSAAVHSVAVLCSVFFPGTSLAHNLRVKQEMNIVLLRLVPQVGQRAAVVQANLACAEYLR